LPSIDPRWLVEAAPDFYNCKEVSLSVSGSSGKVGLPQQKPLKRAPAPENTSGSNANTNRIIFRRPTTKTDERDAKRSKLPVHIGKSKGGLRSQF